MYRGWPACCAQCWPSPLNDGCLFGEEEGIVDGGRLAQLISSPAERRVFRQDRFTPISNCLVSILVDCSGSMKAHIEPVATLVDILLRALDMAGVSSELLGFTTGTWNGGRAWKDWRRAGEPAHPGRLNEVRHIGVQACRSQLATFAHRRCRLAKGRPVSRRHRRRGG